MSIRLKLRPGYVWISNDIEASQTAPRRSVAIAALKSLRMESL